MFNKWYSTYDKKTGEGFTTDFDLKNNQGKELTHVFENLHICSLRIAKENSYNDYYSINLTDESSYQKYQAHLPVGEIVSMMDREEIKNWKTAIEYGISLAKSNKPFIIHCHAGIHRSTLVSSAVLTLTYPDRFPTLLDAHRFVLSKRTIGWKKQDTFEMMEKIVADMRNENKTILAFDYINDKIPSAPFSQHYSRLSLF
tara:strand:+ start:2533 stop:3132 length:600 start_codon:yes stop_codon:yes gene_type:complete